LSGTDQIPTSLKRIRLEGGRLQAERFEPGLIQRPPTRGYTSAWEGRMPYGLHVCGRAPAGGESGYGYVRMTQSTGVTEPVWLQRKRESGCQWDSLWRGGWGRRLRWRARIVADFFGKELTAGGWGFWEVRELAGPRELDLMCPSTAMDPVGKTLYQGTGERRRAEDQ
jgi:hypothetical protein